jgi:putative Ca2+/H+ antiporter (TMEM165/GDT1 family)
VGAHAIGPDMLRRVLGALFLGMAVWALIPDKPDDDGAAAPRLGAGPFVATTVAFFLAEIGDNTQLATAALAAQFEALVPVVIGTTLGMLIADVPAVFVGHRAAHRVNLTLVRRIAAAIFAALGVLALSGIGRG